jgi:hypothetical protein
VEKEMEILNTTSIRMETLKTLPMISKPMFLEEVMVYFQNIVVTQ